MSDPIEKLQNFYESCNGAEPPMTATLAPRAGNVAFWRFASLLGPAAGGFAVAALAISLAAGYVHTGDSFGSRQILERQMLQSGMALDSVQFEPAAYQKRTELPNWRA